MIDARCIIYGMKSIHFTALEYREERRAAKPWATCSFSKRCCPPPTLACELECVSLECLIGTYPHNLAMVSRFKGWARIVTPTSVYKLHIAAKRDWSHETQSLDDLSRCVNHVMYPRRGQRSLEQAYLCCAPVPEWPRCLNTVPPDPDTPFQSSDKRGPRYLIHSADTTTRQVPAASLPRTLRLMPR